MQGRRVERHPAMSLASVKPCPVLGSALGHESPNRKQRLNPAVGEGEAALTIFLLSRSQKKWMVSGSFSQCDQHPWPFRQLEVAEKGNPASCCLVKHAALPMSSTGVGGWRGRVRVPASILVWIRSGLIKRTPDTLPKSRTTAGSRSPVSDFPDKSQYSLSTKTRLSQECWGRDAKSGLGPPTLGWLIPLL